MYSDALKNEIRTDIYSKILKIKNFAQTINSSTAQERTSYIPVEQQEVLNENMAERQLTMQYCCYRWPSRVDRRLAEHDKEIYLN